MPVMLLMTATPLHTSPLDLYNLGAMIGIPSLATQGGFEGFHQHQREITKLKKWITQEDLNDKQGSLMKSTNPGGSTDDSTAMVPKPGSGSQHGAGQMDQ
jgi:hypothetical protein